VDGHGIVQGTDQITNPVDSSLGHIRILSECWPERLVSAFCHCI
jgi:hypothetical protein